MVSWNVDSAIVPDETIIHFHAAIMVKGAGDCVVPEVCVPSGGSHILVGLVDGGHDHRPEVLWGQDDYLIVIVLPLIMICSSREEVCLFIGGAGFMMEGKMVFR